MKNALSLLLPLVFATGFCKAANNHAITQPRDTLISDITIAKYLDTNIIVYNLRTPLHFYQYKDSIKTNRHQIFRMDTRMILSQQWPEFKFYNRQDSISGLMQNIIYTLGKHVLPAPPLDKKLLKNLPNGIDTTLIIYNQYRAPLKFQEYFARLFYFNEYLSQENGEKYLWCFSDRMNQDRPFLFKSKADTLRRLQDVYRQLLMADRVLVLKSKRLVYLQRGNKTFMTMHCELGKNPVGDKFEEGDGRTPEGIYTIVSTAEKGKYGKSLQISYPDQAHITAAKKKGKLPGKDVMIHGTSDARKGKKDWTNGCIALSNQHIDSLFKYVPSGIFIEIRK